MDYIKLVILFSKNLLLPDSLFISTICSLYWVSFLIFEFVSHFSSFLSLESLLFLLSNGYQGLFPWG